MTQELKKPEKYFIEILEDGSIEARGGIIFFPGGFIRTKKINKSTHHLFDE